MSSLHLVGGGLTKVCWTLGAEFEFVYSLDGVWLIVS